MESVPYLFNHEQAVESSVILKHNQKTLPKAVKKYWPKRYVLFKKFDQGIKLTSELWYSVTPEEIAVFIAKFIKHCYPEATTVLDLFCGGGGNTIQFARFFNTVYAIDYNELNLKCTLHNCEIYGIDKKVLPIQCDWSDQAADLMEHLNANVDIVFASPPWGGPGYTNEESFDLEKLQPLPIRELLISCLKVSDHIVLFLPRNSNLDQLSALTEDLGLEKCRVLYVYLHGGLKGIMAFWGKSFTSYKSDETSY